MNAFNEHRRQVQDLAELAADVARDAQVIAALTAHQLTHDNDSNGASGAVVSAALAGDTAMGRITDHCDRLRAIAAQLDAEVMWLIGYHTIHGDKAVP